MEKKLIQDVGALEIIINYAEAIIDEATELQCVLIEQERNQKNEKQSNLPKKMPELRELGSNKERSQNTEEKKETSVEVQKMYIPVYRLSQKNNSPNKSAEKS